jgi:hypothetical protein
MLRSVQFLDLNTQTLMILDDSLQIELDGICDVEPRLQLEVEIRHVNRRDVDLLGYLLDSFEVILTQECTKSVCGREFLTIFDPLAQIPDFIGQVDFRALGCI